MTRQYNNYEDMITFTRASTGTALRPISYGAELVTNGTFDTDLTGWTTQSGTSVFTVSSGQLTISRSAVDPGYVYQIIPTISGNVYYVSFDVVDDGPIDVRIGTSPGALQIASSGIKSSAGTYTLVFVATGSTAHVSAVNTSYSVDVIIDNISVKEVTFDQPNGTLTLFNHPTNVPRIEYDADGNWKGLLIEESRTNLLTYSNDFSGQWTLTDVVDTANSIASPDGTSNAFYAVANSTSSNFHRFTSSCSIAQSTTYTFSTYLKAGGYTLGGLSFYDGVAYQARTLFDLSDGTISSTIEGSATIEDVGNGWYRCSITGTTDAAASASGTVYISVNSLYGYTGDDASGIYSYGAQLEEGAFPTSYIPTSGATATRATDNCGSLPFSNFGYNNKEGTFVVEFSYTDPDDSDTNYLISGGSSARFFYNNTATSAWSTYDGVSAVTTTDVPQDGTVAKVAIAMSNSGTATYLNGTIKGSNSSIKPQGNVGDYLFIGGTGGVTMINGHIKSIQYYPRRLSDAQLQALTS